MHANRNTIQANTVDLGDFIKTAPRLDSLGLDASFYSLPQCEKDALIESLINRGAFATELFHGAPHILSVDRPEGLISIWHSKVGGVDSKDFHDELYNSHLNQEAQAYVQNAIKQHHASHGAKTSLDFGVSTEDGFAIEASLDDFSNPHDFALQLEYFYLYDVFNYATGRAPRRRHSLKVQAGFCDESPVSQHVHIDKTNSTRQKPVPDGFVQLKTVLGKKTTEVVPRPLSRSEIRDAYNRRREADTVAAELGAVPTPIDSIFIVKMSKPYDINYETAVGHRFPTIKTGETRLSIGMVE